MLFITQMSNEQREMKSIENEDLFDCQAMPQHNGYEIHNYVMTYTSNAMCVWRVQTQHLIGSTQCPSFPLKSYSILPWDFTSNEFSRNKYTSK